MGGPRLPQLPSHIRGGPAPHAGGSPGGATSYPTGQEKPSPGGARQLGEREEGLSPRNAGHGGPGPLCLSQLETRLGHAGDTCLPGGRLPFCTIPLRRQALPGVHTMSLTSFPEGGRPAPRTRTIMTAQQGAPQGPPELAEVLPSPPPETAKMLFAAGPTGEGGRQAGPPDTQPDHAGPLADSRHRLGSLASLPGLGPRPQRDPCDREGGAWTGIAAGVSGCDSKCAQVGVTHGPRGSRSGDTHILSLWVICEPPAWAEEPCPHGHLWEPTHPPRMPEQACPSGWAGGGPGSRPASRV